MSIEAGPAGEGRQRRSGKRGHRARVHWHERVRAAARVLPLPVCGQVHTDTQCAPARPPFRAGFNGESDKGRTRFSKSRKSDFRFLNRSSEFDLEETGLDETGLDETT